MADTTSGTELIGVEPRLRTAMSEMPKAAMNMPAKRSRMRSAMLMRRVFLA